MPRSTFKESANYVIMELPGGISHDELRDQLEKDLIPKLKDHHSGLLVDVSALNEDDEHFKSVGRGIGQYGRDKIDPQLASRNISKVAFVSSNGRFHGSENSNSVIIKKNAPVKRYFSDRRKAEQWLENHSCIYDIAILKVHAQADPEDFKKELENLVRHLRDCGKVDGVLVDVAELTWNRDNYKKLGNEIGQWARSTIDPALKNYVSKVAFVDPSSEFHGRGMHDDHPIVAQDAPIKQYFHNYEQALGWLQS